MKTIDKTCEKCGAIFSVSSNRKNQKFCSVTCSSSRTFKERRPSFTPAEQPKTYPHICECCGETFYRRKFPYTPRFCSNHCKVKMQHVEGNAFTPRKITSKTFVCAHCGKTAEQKRKPTGGFGNARYCSKECGYQGRPKPQPVERSKGCIHHTGYRYIKSRGRDISEHKYVMEQHLGRPLYSYENIHHKNGIRDDNRLENLELWVTKQPFGQRTEDVIDWAVMFLKQHGYTVSKN